MNKRNKIIRTVKRNILTKVEFFLSGGDDYHTYAI